MDSRFGALPSEMSTRLKSSSKPAFDSGVVVLPSISPTRGCIRGSRIMTVQSKMTNSRRKGRKPVQKEFEELTRSYNDSRKENIELQNQVIRLQTIVLEERNQLSILTKQYEELNGKYSMLAHLEKWGDIIRAKNNEIKRQQAEIQKMVMDRMEALNDMKTAEVAVQGLKSKLRGKNREINEVRITEKILCKAVVLSETESLRNERDMALGKLVQRDAIIASLRLELKNIEQKSLHTNMTLQEEQRNKSTKDKQLEDVRKRHVIGKFKLAAVHALCEVEKSLEN